MQMKYRISLAVYVDLVAYTICGSYKLSKTKNIDKE